MFRLATTIMVLGCALLASACGAPSQVTYVDPNGPSDGVQAGSGGAPFEKHGAAALARARACIGIRAALAAARTLADSNVDAAAATLDDALDNELPAIEPRAAVTIPSIVSRLRVEMERLRDTPPGDMATYADTVHSIDASLLQPTCDAAVPIEARQDVSFRAAMLAQTIEDAASAYESAFNADGTQLEDVDAYRRAYGLLVDASTRQLEAVPENRRAEIREKLARIMRSSTPSPTPTGTPRDPAKVVGELSALQDDITFAARVDTSFPEPDQLTPDHLRSLKRGLAAAVEVAERGDKDAATMKLRSLDASALQPAAAGIAAVSPELLASIERQVLIELPTAITQGGDVATIASDLDANIDEALSLVEEELDALASAR